MNQTTGILITTTPQQILLDSSRRYSFKHSQKSDTIGTVNTSSSILVNEMANSFDNFRAAPGYWWLGPGEVYNHAGGIPSIWVRTDSGQVTLLIAPDFEDNS